MKFQINITLQINKQIKKKSNTYEIYKSYWRYIFKKIYSQQVGFYFIKKNTDK